MALVLVGPRRLWRDPFGSETVEAITVECTNCELTYSGPRDLVLCTLREATPGSRCHGRIVDELIKEIDRSPSPAELATLRTDTQPPPTSKASP